MDRTPGLSPENLPSVSCDGEEEMKLQSSQSYEEHLQTPVVPPAQTPIFIPNGNEPLMQTVVAADGSTPTIARLSSAYRMFCQVRSSSELSLRGSISEERMPGYGLPLLPATYESINQATHVLIHALFDFISTAFEGVSTLSGAHKWLIVKNCIFPFTYYENVYRGVRDFPHDNMMGYAGMTSYVDGNRLEEHVRDAPDDVNKELGIEISKQLMKADIANCRDELKAKPIDEVEFIVGIGLVIFNISGAEVPEVIQAISNTAKEALLHELGIYYRLVYFSENGSLNNCREKDIAHTTAERIGNLIFHIVRIQKTAQKVMESLHLMKVLNACEDSILAMNIIGEREPQE